MGVAARLASDVIDVLVVGGVYREQFSHREPRSRIGGSGLYAAVAAAALGASTALAASVGAEDAEELRAILSNADVDGDAVELRPGQSAAFFIEEEGEVEAPSVQFKSASSPPELTHDPQPARVVLIFGMPDLDPFAMGLVARWVGQDSTLIWDRQGWLSKPADATAAAGVRAHSRIYLANIGEAAQEAGEATLDQIVLNHPLPGFDWAILKNGRWGTTLLGHGTPIAIPAFRVPVVSTIGSGDVFAGALAACLAVGEHIETASLNAAAAASISISRASPLLAPASRREIDEIVSTGDGRYTDPVQLSAVSIAVDIQDEGAVEAVADQLRVRLRNLGIGIAGTATEPTLRVALRADSGRVVAAVSGSTDTSQVIELGQAIDLEELVDVIADRIEAGIS